MKICFYLDNNIKEKKNYYVSKSKRTFRKRNYFAYNVSPKQMFTIKFEEWKWINKLANKIIILKKKNKN